MNDKNKNLNIMEEWKQAEESLQAAEVLLEKKLPRQAATRVYYAAFHAARSLLFSEGLESKTHRGVIQLFNLHFISNGKMDSSYAHLLSRTQREREDADYLTGFIFTESAVEERLKMVRDFLSVVRKYLQEAGYLLDISHSDLSK